ncbi:MAG: DUF4097 family beta strand repeat-containing protein [Bacteroidota bacterium]
MKFFIEELSNMKKCLFTVVLLLIGLSLTTDLFASEIKLIKEKSIPAKSGDNLYVDASGADVKVFSWDKNEVYIKIYGNERAKDKMEFRIENVDGGVKVIAKKKDSWFFSWGGGYSVRIEASVPYQYNPLIETSGGDIEVYGLTGKFNLDTSGGDVLLKDSKGVVDIETSGGDITLNNHKGKAEVSTSGGDIRTIKHNGGLRASTSGGDINIESNDGSVSAKTSGGDVEINYSGSNEGIYASTSGGDIRVTIPSAFKANVDLETTGGDIDCNFSNSRSNKVKRGELKAEFNGGGEKLVCSTSGGDIDILEK